MTTDLTFLPAVRMAEMVRRRQLSPVEIVRAHLAAIEALNPRLNAVVTLIGDAEHHARAAEAAVRRGEPLGPLPRGGRRHCPRQDEPAGVHLEVGNRQFVFGRTVDP